MKLKELYNKIIALDDLKPSAEVNALFSELVSKAIDLENKEKLSFNERIELQKLCSLSEYQLERYWVEKILASENAEEMLRSFPYFQNYKELTKLEYYALNGCVEHSDHQMLFIGGGPLPLTAIVLALDFGVKSTVLDIDESAVALSTELIRRLGLENMIQVVQKSGAEFTEYSDFNVIFIAALAGIDAKTKRGIFSQVKKFANKGTHILARSSWGNRKLLYRPLSKRLFKEFTPIIEVNPFHQVVNSVVVFKYDR
jgi:nicotianamine synthase